MTRNCTVLNLSGEICYNIKYVNRNGRPKGDPWSLRQIGVYEKHNLKTGQSLWIVIQPSERACRRFKEGLVARSALHGSECAVMLVHAALLIGASRDWGEYLEELNEEIQGMVCLPSHKTG